LHIEREYFQKEKNDEHKERWINEDEGNTLLESFARQLGLVSDEDLKDFKIAGLAGMLAGGLGLNPHRDGSNPHGKLDRTIQVNVVIKVVNLSTQSQSIVATCFGNDIDELPFTLILYPRKCHINYANKMAAIKTFTKENPRELIGRSKMVEILNDVGSTLDFNSRCFTVEGYKARLDSFENVSEGFVTSPAAVDKMVSLISFHVDINIYHYYKNLHYISIPELQ